MTIPTTIDDAYKIADPGKPLELGSDDPRYVDCSDARGDEDEVAMMARAIRRSGEPNYAKLLFTGHRGCGKSTELFRLKRRLEKDGYFVVYFDADIELDIGDVDYPDVLLTVAQQTETQLRQAGIELDAKLLEEIARWFGTTVVTEQQGRDVQRTLETEYGLGLQAPFVVFAKMLAAFKGEIKNSSGRRVEIRRELERKATELIQRVNDLIHDAQVRLKRAGRRELVLIVDGLDRLIYRELEGANRNTHNLVFIEHGEQLRSPHCHMVMTFPINLTRGENVGQTFFEYHSLPMIKIREEKGAPCDAGLKRLRDIIANRMDVSAVFESPRQVDELVVLSGGHVRDLLRLVRYAFDYTDTIVRAADVDKAMRKLVNEYNNLIPDDALPLLHQVHRTRRLPNDEPHSLLLHNLLVLEYKNHDAWYDVHPAVQATRKFSEFRSPEPIKKSRQKK